MSHLRVPSAGLLAQVSGASFQRVMSITLPQRRRAVVNVSSGRQHADVEQTGLVTVIVTEALDRGRITESIHILVPVDRMKQKCFQNVFK